MSRKFIGIGTKNVKKVICKKRVNFMTKDCFGTLRNGKDTHKPTSGSNREIGCLSVKVRTSPDRLRIPTRISFELL